MTKKQIGWMSILALVVFTNIIESMILMPLSSTIKAALSMDDNQWGVIISSYLFSAFIAGILTFITNPFIGYLSDRFGQMHIFLIMMLLSCVPIGFITAMGENPMPLVLLATSGFFIFAGGRNIPGTALVNSTAAPYERGGFMSIRSAVQQLASGIAVLLGSWILTQDATGKYFNFEIIGYIAIGTSILSYFILKIIKSEY